MSIERLYETKSVGGKLFASNAEQIRSRKRLTRNCDVRFVLKGVEGNGVVTVADYDGPKSWKKIEEVLNDLYGRGIECSAFVRVCVEEADMHPEIEIPKSNDYSFLQYVETALWSSILEETDEDGEQRILTVDSIFSVEDLDSQSRRNLYSMWNRFQQENSELLSVAMDDTGNDITQVAHDFWLTSNGHGAGFLDGCWLTPNRDFGQELKTACEGFRTGDSVLFWKNGDQLEVDGLFDAQVGVNLSTMEMVKWPNPDSYSTKKTLQCCHHNNELLGVSIERVTQDYIRL